MTNKTLTKCLFRAEKKILKQQDEINELRDKLLDTKAELNTEKRLNFDICKQMAKLT